MSKGSVQSVVPVPPRVKPVAAWKGYRYHGRTVDAQTVQWQANLLYLEGSSWKSVADRYTYVSARFDGWTTEPAMRPFHAANVAHGHGEYRVRETLTWLKPIGNGQHRDGWITEHAKTYTYGYDTTKRGYCGDLPPTCTNPADVTAYAGQSLVVPLSNATDPDGDPLAAGAFKVTNGTTAVDGVANPAKKGGGIRLTTTQALGGQTLNVSYTVHDPAGAASSRCSFALTVTPAFREKALSDTATWSDYHSAGGTAGPPIKAKQSVIVDCWVHGKQSADNDTYWYRIVQKPWSDGYYAPADNFNNGATDGTTVAVDPDVPAC
jgi:hypothetical protein